MKIVRTIRTQKTIKKYLKFINDQPLKGACGICREKNVKEFKYWRIIKARFPLDKIAQIDHVIIVKRHVHINKLTTQEKNEFELIKTNYIRKKYDALLEGTPNCQSVLDHHHVHLLVFKQR